MATLKPCMGQPFNPPRARTASLKSKLGRRPQARPHPREWRSGKPEVGLKALPKPAAESSRNGQPLSGPALQPHSPRVLYFTVAWHWLCRLCTASLPYFLGKQVTLGIPSNHVPPPLPLAVSCLLNNSKAC